MPVNESLRLEAIYFQNLRSMIDTLKGWKASEEPGKIYDIIDSCISANSAILLLYKNLGESAADFAAQIKQTGEALDKFKTAVEIYKDELNEKIDDVNNYLNALISDLEQRVQALEGREEVIILYLTKDENNNYFLKDKDGLDVSFDTAKDYVGSTICLVKFEDEYGSTFLQPVRSGIVDADYPNAIRWAVTYNPNITVNGYVQGATTGTMSIELIYDNTDGLVFNYLEVDIPTWQEFFRNKLFDGGWVASAGQDLNNAGAGIQFFPANSVNNPTSYGGFVITIGRNDDTLKSKVQFFFSGGVGNRFYVRYFITSSWSNWYSGLLQGSM